VSEKCERMRGKELNSVPFVIVISCCLRYGSLTTDWLYYLIISMCIIESDIVYCVFFFSCPRAISIVSSNQILCHCSAILLITGNYIYLPVFYSAILLFTGIIPFTGILLFCYSTHCHCWVCLSAAGCWVLVLSFTFTILYWYLFTIHLLLKTDIVFTYSTVHNV
jgi:hypothetical protein